MQFLQAVPVGRLLLAYAKGETAIRSGSILYDVSGFAGQIWNINSGKRVAAFHNEQIAGGERLQHLPCAHRRQRAFQAFQIDRLLQLPGPFFP